jgi:hypothetical protein
VASRASATTTVDDDPTVTLRSAFQRRPAPTHGRHRVVHMVVTSEALPELYGTDVDVLRIRGRLVVMGAEAVRRTRADHHEPQDPYRAEGEVR